MSDKLTHGWRYALAAALTGGVLLAGCGTARPAATTAPAGPALLPQSALHQVTGTGTYLGAVPGTQALIAIVAQGGRARAYLCDGLTGSPAAATLADWFAGPVRDRTLDAISTPHRADLSARLGPRTATGTVTLANGRVIGFTAPLTAPSTQAGLFEGTMRYHGLPFHAGLITLPDGDQRGSGPSGIRAKHSQ